MCGAILAKISWNVSVAAVEVFRDGIGLEAALVAGEHAVPLPRLLPIAPDVGHRAHEAPTLAFALLHVPGLLGFAREKRAPVELEQAIAEAFDVAGGKGRAGSKRALDLVDERVECQRVDPEIAAIEGEAAIVQRDRLVLTEELAP